MLFWGVAARVLYGAVDNDKFRPTDPFVVFGVLDFSVTTDKKK